uniref:Uncharacterized protein n=1 Tax=Megaselia scalaris TaxID=36166 RepID=T1GK65_MEGSC
MIVLVVIFLAPMSVQMLNMNYAARNLQVDEYVLQEEKSKPKPTKPQFVEVPEEYINPVDRIMSDLNGVIRKYPHHRQGLADKLYDEVKVLCWVNTWPKNHKTRAKAVKETWAKRCNKVLFISTQEDPELDAVALPLKDGRQYLWSKIRGAFKH